MLKDYQKALQDLDKAHILEPNNVFIVTMHGDVKETLINLIFVYNMLVTRKICLSL